MLLVLAACCSPPFVEPITTRRQDFGGGAATATLTDHDGNATVLATEGVAADDWSGNYADGQTALTATESYAEADGPPEAFDGTLYIRVCVPVETAECGDVTLCYVGWVERGALDGEAHAQGASLEVSAGSEMLGTTSDSGDARVRIDEVTRGAASLVEPAWRTGDDDCLATFAPARVDVAWDFDDEPIASREGQMGCE